MKWPLSSLASVALHLMVIILGQFTFITYPDFAGLTRVVFELKVQLVYTEKGWIDCPEVILSGAFGKVRFSGLELFNDSNGPARPAATSCSFDFVETLGWANSIDGHTYGRLFLLRYQHRRLVGGPSLSLAVLNF